MACLSPLKIFIPGVSPTDMIRLGLIGCGEHAEGSHAIPLARYASENPGEIFLAAACDLRLERAKQFCGRYGFARAYADFEEMLSKEDLDGCISVMPMERITEIGMRLLQSRIPCVIENVSGIKIIVRKAGSPSSIFPNEIFATLRNIDAPTSIKTEAVA